MMHPSDEIRGSKSNSLSNKQIVLGVTGSIAAVESVKLARELIRHGAEVIPVMTKWASEIIHPNALEFATGIKPIIKLTGDIEHVKFCGLIQKPSDILVISPCTANTISKIAHGIDDTTVTTFATTALGSKIPVIIVPAMHLSMYDHDIIKENIRKCKKIGIKFVYPKISASKAKISDNDIIVANIIRKIGKKDLKGKKILVIGGASSEKIDEVRTITNISSGKTAISIAKVAFLRGGDVKLWYGKSNENPPQYIDIINFKSIFDLKELIENGKINKFDIIILCAALSDFIPNRIIGKISSEKENLELNLKPAPKIIKILKNHSPNSKIICFKLEDNVDKIEKGALKILNENHADFVIGNTISTLGSDFNDVIIFSKNGLIEHFKGKKTEISNYIYDFILKE